LKSLHAKVQFCEQPPHPHPLPRGERESNISLPLGEREKPTSSALITIALLL
jgi:hypothetical protein